LPACLCVRNFRSRRWCGDRFDDWLVGHQFEPNYLHHPVFRYRTSLGVFAFFPRNAGFRPFLVVSVSVSGERKAGFCTPVSASKISVPRSGGDRFDDWVVGPQFEPYCLHHPVLGFGPPQVIRQFVRGNRDFLASALSLDISLLGDEAASAVLSLRRRIPFPAPVETGLLTGWRLPVRGGVFK
jgi:hypothetical protein